MAIYEVDGVPSSVTVTLADRTISLMGSGETWQAGGISVTLAAQTDGTDITLCADVPVLQVKLRWQSRPGRPLRFLGDHWERGYGDLEWRGYVAERVMPWYFLVYDGTVTDGYGVKTGANALCGWYADEEGVTLSLDVRCGGVGVELTGPLTMARFVVREGQTGESPFAAARAFCSVLCDAPRMPETPVYGGNDWYYAYGSNSRDSILADAARVSDWAGGAENRPFMVVDDGWERCRHTRDDLYNNGGPWESGAAFGDMAKLVQDMHSLGVRPGIWNRPLLYMEDCPEAWVLPRNRFAGRPSHVTILDPTVPEVKQRVAEDIRRIAGWGFEIIKHDFTTFDLLGRWGFAMGETVTADGWAFSDRSKTTAQIIKDLYQTIVDAAGDSMILGCNTIGHLGAGLFAMQRTGDDTSGLMWERTRKMGINTLAFRAAQHGAFFAVDADCVGLTNRVPWRLNAQWLRLLSKSGTPLFVSADPEAVDPEQDAALREAFAFASVPQPLAEPLDWMETTCPRSWRLCGETCTFSWAE